MTIINNNDNNNLLLSEGSATLTFHSTI